MERNVIITANEKINGTKLEKFLLDNIDNFQEKTDFIVLSGHHHEMNKTDRTVSVGKTDPNLIDGFDGAFERLYQHSKSHSCKSECQKCLWKAKKTKLILRFAVSIFTYSALSQAPIDDLLQV